MDANEACRLCPPPGACAHTWTHKCDTSTHHGYALIHVGMNFVMLPAAYMLHIPVARLHTHRIGAHASP